MLKLWKLYDTLCQTWSSSSNNANFLQCFNVECHTVENIRKIDAIAQSIVSELNLSFIRPQIWNTKCTGLFSAFLWQILQVHINSPSEHFLEFNINLMCRRYIHLFSLDSHHKGPYRQKNNNEHEQAKTTNKH